jgi:protein-disulfide isomerase
MKTTVKIVLIVVAIAAIGFAAYSYGTRHKVAADTKPAAANTTADSNTGPSATQLTLSDTDLSRGDKNAPIILVEYSDFQCPYCVRFGKTMQDVEKAYTGKIRWVFRHFPLPFHQNAKKAAYAAEAANRQGKFTEYSDLLLANSQSDGTGLNDADLLKYATQLNLNIDQFTKDMTDPLITNKVDAQEKEGESYNIQGTPTTFIVNQSGKVLDTIGGAYPIDQVEAKIDAALKLQ